MTEAATACCTGIPAVHKHILSLLLKRVIGAIFCAKRLNEAFVSTQDNVQAMLQTYESVVHSGLQETALC